jgi:hypothetical protein
MFKFAIMVVLLASSLSAQQIPPRISIDKLPENVDELLRLRGELARNPSGAAALFAVALQVYARNKQAGIPMLISMLVNDGSLMSQSTRPGNYRGYDLSNNTKFLVDQLDSKPWVPNSYVVGTSPQNGYALSASGPYHFDFTQNQYSIVKPDEEVRIFIACTGADSPRPIRLKKNTEGIWKVAEFSSLVTGIRAPASTARDEL